MADLTIHEFQNEATAPAANDYMVLDGATAGTRKIDANKVSYKSELNNRLFTVPLGDKTVAQVNALTGMKNGDSYIVTDSGTLTDGSLAVVAGEQVAWDATNGVWYKLPQYALKQFGTNAIKDLATTKYTGFMALDDADGTGKMYVSTIFNNFAPAFDATRTSENPYKAGEIVVYEGKTYRFFRNHYGAWTGLDVENVNSFDFSSDLYNRIVSVQKLTFVGKGNSYCYTVIKPGRPGFYKLIMPNSSWDLTGLPELVQDIGFGTWDGDTTYTYVVRHYTNSTYPVIGHVYTVEVTDENPYIFLEIKAATGEKVDIGLCFSEEYRLQDYLKNAGTSGRLSFHYTPSDSVSKYVQLRKNYYDGASSYDIFASDSTGTKANAAYAKDVPFGELILLKLPEGYNRWLFFKAENTTNLIDVTLFGLDESSLEGARKEFLYSESVEGNVIQNYVKNAGTEGRISFYWEPPYSQHACVKMVKNTYADASSYSVFASDSTGTNPDSLYLSDVLFGETIILDLPEGYNRWLFFKAEKTNNLIDVTLYSVVEHTLRGKNVIQDAELRIVSKDMYSNLYPLKGKKVICFGDSITQFRNPTDGKGYPEYLEEISKATVVNGGIGGTRYSLRTTVVDTPTTGSQAWAALDIYNLIHSWINNSWTSVDAAVAYLAAESGSHNYTSIINKLKSNPISSVDYVTLMGGANDFTGGTLLGAVNNNDTSTTLGALSKIVQELLTANPKIRIFIFSPNVRWFGEGRLPENWCDVYVRDSGTPVTLKEFAQGIIDAGRLLHTPMCDLYGTLGWNMWNFSEFFPTDDAHPYNGFMNIAKRVHEFIWANMS